MKKAVLATILASLVISSSAAMAEDNISVTVDGETIVFDEQPRIINDSVMVPMRKIFEKLGAEISWDSETNTVTAIKNAQYVKFTAENDAMELGVCKGGVNSGELSWFANNTLDSAPMIINGAMFVPARAVSEAFYYDVNWDADDKCVEITTPTDADGWIYYSSWSDDGHMYKIDTNGQNRQLLSDNDCYMEYARFLYYDGYIYYSIRVPEDTEQEGCLYRIKTDGTGEEKLTDKPVRILHNAKDMSNYYTADENGNFYMLMGEKGNGYIYSYSNAYLYKFDTKTGELEKLIEEPVNYSSVSVYGDYIYFKYNDDTLDRAYSYYRMDKDGTNIIKVTGDIAADYLRFDVENDRIRFSSYAGSSSKAYTAGLDGSDLQVWENEYDYRRDAEKYGLTYVTDIGDGFVIGAKAEDYESYYVVDEDGNELFVITPPEDFRISKVECSGDKIFYEISTGYSHEQEKLYVSSLDEIMGMENISVGSEMVDGKYEIMTRNWISNNPSGFQREIHSVNCDGSDDMVIITGYRLSGADENELRLYSYGSEEQEAGIYRADLDGGNIRKYESEYDSPDVVKLNEEAAFGIVVRNDGTLESYYQPRKIVWTD